MKRTGPFDRFLRTLGIENAPIWTSVILAACIGLYAITVKATSDLTDGASSLTPNNQALIHYGATVGILELEAGQWWRIVTAIFLHGGVLHLVLNAAGLWTAGQVVEERFGRGQFLVVFLVTGVCGYLFSLWLSGEHEFSVGASGAIFGLIGFVVGHVVRQRGRARDLRERFVPWLLYGVVFSFTPHVNWRAHLGGLAAGFLLGLVVADEQTARRWLPAWAWTIAGGLAVAVMVAAFVLAAQAPPIEW
jgi:rhomboid protease GluP